MHHNVRLPARIPILPSGRIMGNRSPSPRSVFVGMASRLLSSASMQRLRAATADAAMHDTRLLTRVFSITAVWSRWL